jgi:hypothetical protein
MRSYYLNKFGCTVFLLLLQSTGLDKPRHICGVSILDLQSVYHSAANYFSQTIHPKTSYKSSKSLQAPAQICSFKTSCFTLAMENLLTCLLSIYA